MTVLRDIHAQQSNNTVISCRGLITQTLTNVLKESVVVHRIALTQMGAITALAMMATSLQMMIITAMVYKTQINTTVLREIFTGLNFHGWSISTMLLILAFTDARTPSHCVLYN